MRIRKTDTQLISKVIGTLDALDRYKQQLREYSAGLQLASKTIKSRRIPSFLLTHFTNLADAKKIIDSGHLDTSANGKGYVALSELNPFEFETITQSRMYGFGFLKDELISSGLDLASPVAASSENGIIAELRRASPSLAERLIVEAKGTQPGLSFFNMAEVRSFSNIPLTHCRLFFRETDLDGRERSAALNELGIFQLPHRAAWFRDYFLTNQLWSIREEGDFIEIYDNRNEVYTPAELRARLIALAESITGLQTRAGLAVEDPTQTQ